MTNATRNQLAVFCQRQTIPPTKHSRFRFRFVARVELFGVCPLLFDGHPRFCTVSVPHTDFSISQLVPRSFQSLLFIARDSGVAPSCVIRFKCRPHPDRGFLTLPSLRLRFLRLRLRCSQCLRKCFLSRVFSLVSSLCISRTLTTNTNLALPVYHRSTMSTRL